MSAVSRGHTVLCQLALEILHVSFRFLSDLHGSLWSTVPDVISGDMESAMAVELNPWVEYEFRVVATNKIGTGDPSAPSRVIRTNEAGKMRIKNVIFPGLPETITTLIVIHPVSLVHICVSSHHCFTVILFGRGSHFVLVTVIVFNLQKFQIPLPLAALLHLGCHAFHLRLKLLLPALWQASTAL